MSDRERRESFDRRQALTELLVLREVAHDLSNAHDFFCLAKGRKIDWTLVMRDEFDSGIEYLVDLIGTIKGMIKTQDELLGEDAPNQRTHGSLR